MNIKKLIAGIVVGSLGLFISYCAATFLFVLFGWIPEQNFGVMLTGLLGCMLLVMGCFIGLIAWSLIQLTE